MPATNPMTNSGKSRTVSVADRKIHVTEYGEGYPVILLHGGGPGASGISNYSRNIEYLAGSFRVIVPDMPGYGQSSKGISGFDPFGDLAETMLGLMDAMDLSCAHLIGNSLGGACALRMALENPQAVSALILMGPGGVDTTRSLPTKGLNKLLNYYKGNGPSLEKLRTFIREYLVFDGASVPEEVIEERYHASIDPEVIASPPLTRPNNPLTLFRMDFTRDRRLRQCQVPTLVLWGTEDAVNRPSGGRSLQTRMPNCDLHLFSQTGHWIQWERADEFNNMCRAFLSTRAKNDLKQVSR